MISGAGWNQFGAAIDILSFRGRNWRTQIRACQKLDAACKITRWSFAQL